MPYLATHVFYLQGYWKRMLSSELSYSIGAALLPLKYPGRVFSHHNNIYCLAHPLRMQTGGGFPPHNHSSLWHQSILCNFKPPYHIFRYPKAMKGLLAAPRPKS